MLQLKKIFDESHNNIAVGLIMYRKKINFNSASKLFKDNKGNINKIEGMVE